MTAAEAPIIVFVIPCYNEQAGIQHTLTYLLADMAKLEKSKIISPKSYVVLVDDGSTDQTWRLIERITHARPKRVRGLKLSRNVGHQNALLAGLLSQIGKADATISLDADLQDDMSVAAKMVEHFNEGAEIVFAVRRDRASVEPPAQRIEHSHHEISRGVGSLRPLIGARGVAEFLLGIRQRREACIN